MSSQPFRVVRTVEEPLGLFMRPAKDDHKVLAQLISENNVGMTGVLFDPTFCGVHENLRREITNRKLDAVLDPKMMELATPLGHTGARGKLPWANGEPHKPSDFDNKYIDGVADRIAQFVAQHGYSAVVAPVHYLNEGAADPWATIDRDLTRSLRKRLDEVGCDKTVIHYPLATSTRMFLDQTQRLKMKELVRGLPVEQLWLRIQPFGSESGDTVLRRYIEACQDLHALHIPIIAEKTGTLGLALLAFGAVSGLESGVAVGEKFDFSRFKKPPRPKEPGKNRFGRPQRVYLPRLGIFLDRKQASILFDQRPLRTYACTNQNCCPKGHESMILDNRRHFVFARMEEVSKLSSIPVDYRAGQYLEQILRPATDNIGRVLANGKLPADLRKKLETNSKRLAGWRATLGEMSEREQPSFSPLPDRRISREHNVK